MFKLLTKWAMDAHTQKNKYQKEIEAYNEIVSEIRNLLSFRMEEIKKEVFVKGPYGNPFSPSYTKLIFYRNGYIVLETRDTSRKLFMKRCRASKFEGFDLWYNKIFLHHLTHARELIKIQEGLEAKHED